MRTNERVALAAALLKGMYIISLKHEKGKRNGGKNNGLRKKNGQSENGTPYNVPARCQS